MKYNSAIMYDALKRSHPVRGAWIEIKLFIPISPLAVVAPREGCVD